MSDISLPPASEYMSLQCPVCGNMYLHHEAIEWWDRPGGEDSPSTCTIVGAIHEGRVPDHSYNPSDRRHGFRIRFWCEMGCDVPSLDFAQHKGVTLVGWGQ